jgi:hypothetical protein
MMRGSILIRANPERERRIRDLWEVGHTVDEIAAETGYKRGTVGYYVRKLNRANRRRPRLADGLGDQTVTARKPPSPVEIRTSLFPKRIFWENAFVNMTKLMDAGKYEELYYLLQSVELLLKVYPKVQFTEDETKEYVREIQAEVDLKVLTQAMRNLDEISPENRKKLLEAMLRDMGHSVGGEPASRERLADVVDSGKDPVHEKEGELDRLIKASENKRARAQKG